MTENPAEIAKSPSRILFAGTGGFATLTATTYEKVSGALLKITNPTNKVNTVPPQAFTEFDQALDCLESDPKLRFVIFHGTSDRIHAGADVNMFAGGLLPNENPPDFEKVHRYLHQGTKLDLRIKKIGSRIPTVSIIQGERFGGSVEWPLMAQFSVVATDAGISLSEPTIGLVPGWNGILNILLKAGLPNALFIGATCARLNAAQMFDCGIADVLAEPDTLLDTALEVATASDRQTRRTNKRLGSEEELYAILAGRLDPDRYRKLADEAGTMAATPGCDPKELSKFIDKRLGELGKPIAPLALEAIFGLIAKYGSRFGAGDRLGIAEMAHDEAEACNGLMRTADRVRGIDSVLKARDNPLNKIAIYQRN